MNCAFKDSALHVEEHDDARDVVNHVLLSLPPLERGAHKSFGSTLRVLLLVEGVHDVGDDLVVEELPHAVTGKHNYFVVRRQIVRLDLWHSIDADAGSHRIAEAAGHGQPGDVFIFKPNAHRPNLVAQLISIRVNPSVIGNNYGSLVLIVRLVVSTQGYPCAAAARIGTDKHRATVAHIC